MTRLVGRWDHASYDRVRYDPFQKELRPRSTIEFGHPIGQLFGAGALKQITSTEGTIHNHSHAPLLRQWQNALFRFAFHQRVVDLEEIKFFPPEDFSTSGNAPDS